MKTSVMLVATIAVLCAVQIQSAVAIEWYIRADGTGNAPTIQAGIDLASDGDTIHLFPGIYTGTGNYGIDFQGKAITVRCIYGDPSYVAIDCADAPWYQGFVFQTGEGSDSILEAVIIRNANSVGRGGGILCDGGSPLIRNCIIENSAADCGGAVCCDNGGSPTFEDCIITGCQSNRGGAVCSDNDAAPTFENCVIENCSADEGGAIRCESGASPTFIDCVIQDNTAIQAAGISCVTGSSPNFTRCLIVGNEPTGQWGGGLRSESGASPRLIECVFARNSADRGAAICSGESTVTAENCVFYANYSEYSIVFNWTSDDEYIGCTFVANYSEPGSLAYVISIHPVVSYVSLSNTLIAFNLIRPGARFTCTSCNIYGNEYGDWIGELADQLEVRGNFSADPCFCDFEGEDFHLCADSWCLPAHNPWGWDVLVGALGEGCGACDCGGPVPTEKIAWSEVKALYK